VLRPPAASFTRTPFRTRFLDIAQRRVLRARGEFRPFRGGELSLEAFEKSIEYKGWRVFSGKSEMDSQKSPTVSTGRRKALFPRQHRHFWWVELRLGNKTDVPSIPLPVPRFH
jgi:hypothetical protein